MKYKFGTAIRAFTDLVARHERWDILNEEALDCAINVYYRLWTFLECKGNFENLYHFNISKNIELTARFRSQFSFIDEYLDGLLKIGVMAQSPQDKAVFEKMQSDFVDIFKYDIKDAHKKWGWQKDRERKRSEVYDIPNIMSLIVSHSNSMPKEDVSHEIQLRLWILSESKS